MSEAESRVTMEEDVTRNETSSEAVGVCFRQRSKLKQTKTNLALYPEIDGLGSSFFVLAGYVLQELRAAGGRSSDSARYFLGDRSLSVRRGAEVSNSSQ